MEKNKEICHNSPDKGLSQLPFIQAMERSMKKHSTIECMTMGELNKLRQDLDKPPYQEGDPKETPDGEEIKIYKEEGEKRFPQEEVKKDFPELFEKPASKSPKQPLESPIDRLPYDDVLDYSKEVYKEPKVDKSERWNFEVAKREIKKRIQNQVGELQEIQHSLGSKRIRPFWEYKFNRIEKKLMGIGDLHYGALGSDVKYFENTINYIKKTNTAIILMGDLMETATRYSVGAGVYEQKPAPMEQLYDVCEMLEPVKKQILAVIASNHEYRCFKESGFNPVQIMADKLNAPYCGFETFLKLWVKKQKYIVYATHGATGARFAWTKMKALDDLMRYINADVVMMAHTHDALIRKTTIKGLEDKKRFGILTGSFKRDDPHSYEVMKCYPPAEIGVVKVKLFGDRWDIHASK